MLKKPPPYSFYRVGIKTNPVNTFFLNERYYHSKNTRLHGAAGMGKYTLFSKYVLIADIANWQFV